MEIRIQRVYAARAAGDGTYVLVDGLWPRGVGKAALDGGPWLKHVAPSAKLRAWFDHDPAKWNEFCRRYFRELDGNVGGLSTEGFRARVSAIPA